MSSRYLAPTLAAAGLALAVALLGAAVTDLGPWYAGLRMPAWKPPDWLFGPAWTLIFGLAALAGMQWWRYAPSARNRRWMLVLFALNALLNLAWSTLFFYMRRPDWALLEVAVLWLSIVALILATPARPSTPAWLLAPYLVWVTIAAALNFAVVKLNAPFI